VSQDSVSRNSASPNSTSLLLIVDDLEDNRELLKEFMTFLGVPREQIRTAENGAQALLMAQAQTFCLILMDLQMPGMDGTEALRRLRGAGLNTPVVALTAHNLKGDRERLMGMGFDDFLTKPLARGELKRILELYFT